MIETFPYSESNRTIKAMRITLVRGQITFALSQVFRDSRAVFNDGRIRDIITVTMANP